MNLFVSWSGGKDCMLALHRMAVQKHCKATYLVNMCSADGKSSIAHRLESALLVRQANALAIDILQPSADAVTYEDRFKETLRFLTSRGIEGGIFGDIYLQEHREWIERVCLETSMKPYFPLWEENTADLIREFVDCGFKARVVAVNEQFLDASWLGREIDTAFIRDITALPSIDPCAERGEYHSFVYNGPCFRHPVVSTEVSIHYSDHHWFLNIQ